MAIFLINISNNAVEIKIQAESSTKLSGTALHVVINTVHVSAHSRPKFQCTHLTHQACSRDGMTAQCVIEHL